MQQCTSIGRFIRDDQSIRLDIADKLAAYFGLESINLKKNPIGIGTFLTRATPGAGLLGVAPAPEIIVGH